jgi:site-specific DNA recombinase
MADYHAIMERFQERAEEIKQKKMNLYEDYRAGHVSREEYLIKKQKLSEQLVPLEAGIQKVEEGIRKYDEANIIFYSDFARLVDEFRNEEALSPELADAFIEKVLVDKNHNIEVVFKFQDEINMLCMRKAS